jgi:hypothetical protein
MIKKAMVYRRHGNLYLHADSSTNTALWISTAPFLLVRTEVDRQLGEAVRKALEGSKENLPLPDSTIDLLRPVYELAGVDSWRAFVAGTVCCRVIEDGQVITVIPSKKRGMSFEFRPDEATHLVAPSTDDLREAVTKALDQSF